MIEKLTLSLLFVATYYIGYVVGLEVELYSKFKWLFLVVVCAALLRYT